MMNDSVYGSIDDAIKRLRADPDDPDVFGELRAAVNGLFVAHPPTSSREGSAVYARIAESLGSEPVHPRSMTAMALQAIGQGVADAVVERLAEFDPYREDEYADRIQARLRTRPCHQCGVAIEMVECFCDRCLKHVTSQ